MKPCSHLELSRSALAANLRFLRRRLGRKTVLCSVIKGNAYGHGIATFVPMAEACGIDRFAVFNAEEALQAIGARTRASRIMIMGHVPDDAVAWAIENDVETWLQSVRHARAVLAASRQIGLPARVHVELETGMYRTGLEGAELGEVIELLKNNPENLVPAGVCTHLAGAESTANYLRITTQMARFDELCVSAEAAGVRFLQRHCASSAAALSHPEWRLDLARIGIAQYGLWPSEEIRMRYLVARKESGRKRWHDPLRRLLSWKSEVMLTKRVPEGRFVGYGNAHLATRPMVIAVIPLGYALGFTRSLSGRGHVLIRGRRAPVVGLVGMSELTVDVTDIPGVQVPDEVVLIGRQGRHEISVASFTKITPFLNYETLARLPQGIPRIVVD